MIAERIPPRGWTNGPDLSGRRRMVADHFRRVWAIVEEIAASPGHSRRTLADKFHLSERHMQHDLTLIRTTMRLPLVRRNGYRFCDEGLATGDGAIHLQDAQLLVMVLRQAMKDRSVPSDRLHRLVAKLPGMFPAHLQPMVALMLDAMTHQPDRQQQVMAEIGDVLLRGGWAKLHYPSAALPWSIGDQPIVKPELLLPYLDSWFVVGELAHQRGRSVMLPLDAIEAVTLAAGGA